MENALQTLKDVALVYGLQVLGAIAILIAGRIVAGALRKLTLRACGRAKVDETLTKFFGRLIFIAVMVFAALAALAKFGVQTASFVAVLGAAGFAVGFAMQGSLSNFAAGVMLLVFRPFRVGDFVDAAGVAGTVKEIGLFTVTLATPDNVKIIVGNSAVFGTTIKNFSGYDTRRVDMTFGIGYSSDIGRAADVLEGLIKADARILADPPHQIAVSELADSSVNFVVRVWVNSSDYWGVKFDMTRAVKEAFDRNGIEIPFPQRVVHQVSAG